MSPVAAIDRARLAPVNPRNVFGNALVELARKAPEVVGLAADLAGSNKMDLFQAEYPERFFNVGIAEANMMGVAAGLALEGRVPFVSTFAAFASMRAHEQVRTDIAYPNLPVKIIATMAGLSGGAAGPTHQGMEDLGVMRMMPGMTVLAPSDPYQLAELVELAYEIPGPVYIRMGRGDDPVIYDDARGLTLGRAIEARSGTEATIIACGPLVNEALKAAEDLANSGVSVRVLDMHTIRPLDRDAVIRAARQTRAIVTVEDHLVFGGLGSAVAEVVAEAGIATPVLRLGIPDVFSIIGPPAELYRHHGYDAAGIRSSLEALLAR